MLFEHNENWNEAISNFYLLISILLRTRTKDINLESCNTVTRCRDGMFRLFTLQPPLPATQGLHNSWIFRRFCSETRCQIILDVPKTPSPPLTEKLDRLMDCTLCVFGWTIYVSMYSMQTYHTDERF